MCESIDTYNGIRLEMSEEVDKESKNILFHVTMNVEKVRESKMINIFREEVHTELLNQGMIRCGFIDIESLPGFRHGNLIQPNIFGKVKGK